MICSSDILKASILIVDDQEADVSLLEQMLRGAGYVSIASTRDPHEVCELHRKNRYDLILLDLHMPGLDGFQVMEGLKEIETGSYLPVLVITAQPDHKLRALKAGAKDFVSKPFDLAEVLIRVYNMLEVRLLHLETKKLYDRVEAANRELTQALSEVKVLRGILPICSYCKKIRDDKDYWHSVEGYISNRTDAQFSHGFCPECFEKHVKPQLDAMERPENPGGQCHATRHREGIEAGILPLSHQTH
jgi:CheY-like chemotaxis protein